MAKELESGNWTHFTPHFILWVCPETYRRTDECKAQCIHGGRYCTPDPDGDIQQGYSGKEIVQVGHLGSSWAAASRVGKGCLCLLARRLWRRAGMMAAVARLRPQAAAHHGSALPGSPCGACCVPSC